MGRSQRDRQGRFVKGHRFAVGRPQLSAEERQIKEAAKTELGLAFSNCCSMNVDDLAEYVKKGDTIALEAVVGRMMLKAIESGKPDCFFKILDRL